MPPTAISNQTQSAKALSFASYVSFIPIGIATVLLGPMLPILSARWSLNYSQAGALFTVQYVASTCAVALSGLVVSLRGYRFAIKAGLLLVAVALGLLLEGPAIVGVLCIAAYGAGLGISVPAANLLVAEVNAARRSAALNWLNFCWSAGAVACPLLVFAVARTQQTPMFLRVVAVLSLGIAAGIAIMPKGIVEPLAKVGDRSPVKALISHHLGAFTVIAILFFLYVGTENCVGGWVASYAKTLSAPNTATALITPSFFYASLMVGRLLAPFLLRQVEDIKLAPAGLLLACVGTSCLLFSRELSGVLASACAIGFGLSAVYPITISLLGREFGSSSTRLGSTMFVLSNIGGGLLPWIVGVSATHFNSLKTGLFVPLIGCIAMLLFLLRKWSPQPSI